MVDLFIDLSALARTRGDLLDISDLMKSPLSTMSDLASSATSHDRLRGRLRDFGDEWDYGIGKLSDYSGSAAEALQKIGDTFEGLDEELRSALLGEGGDA